MRIAAKVSTSMTGIHAREPPNVHGAIAIAYKISAAAMANPTRISILEASIWVPAARAVSPSASIASTSLSTEYSPSKSLANSSSAVAAVSPVMTDMVALRTRFKSGIRSDISEAEAFQCSPMRHRPSSSP
ncbi:hypothetical protein [Mycolicibacterium tokaiense]|uniref:hypothetical protein n=1 Tax=Mycolicibacterium tokaiense TaxID=39695 RepID=UPI0011C0486D|nr:hypothetical protein [Mycolicibacterium tokaiense]